MNKTDQKKYIVDAIEVRLHELKAQWAKNYLALKVNQGIADTVTNTEKQIDSAKKEVDAATLNMALAEQQVVMFEKMLEEANTVRYQ